MTSKSDPWYIHAALYAVIIILVALLIKVAVIDPTNVVKAENYFKTESRLRMKNIKEGEILFFKRYNHFTGNLDSLISFIKTSPFIDSIMIAYDSVTNKSANPFIKLNSGEFNADSLLVTPKTHTRYNLSVDTSTSVDTVINRMGRIIRIDTKKKIGTKYYLEDPDGYGSIGNLTNEALKNTASWEQ